MTSVRGRGVPAAAAVLAITIFLAPALGATTDEIAQDTLKSAVVAFGALSAALVFFWPRRDADEVALRFHPALALPVVLMLYALGSMGWSHAYLAGGEAIRWFVFAVLMLLAMNVMDRQRLPMLAWAVAAGATVASLWAVLQFLFAFGLFRQGPRPASTFVNRNFFAEFAVCALPFAGLVLARAKRRVVVAAAAVMMGLVVAAVCMTGARAALIAMALFLLGWSVAAVRSGNVGRILIVVAVAGVLGSLPSTDANTALQRVLHRGESVSAADPSLAMRVDLWRASARMIVEHPLAGVGAGAWENQPEAQEAYEAHNEFLQLVAEYGVVGWIFIAAVTAWLCRAAWTTIALGDQDEAAWRATILASLAALFVVSCTGFPWRLAGTGALFALCLGALAASDLRIAHPPGSSAVIALPAALSRLASVATIAAIALAAYITDQALLAERHLARATHIALRIDASTNPNDPAHDADKAVMLRELAEGIRINRHYRRLTPIAADAMARWGDWKDAIWVWESVLSSRPNAVAIVCNVARGYIALGEPKRAEPYIQRCHRREG